MKVKNSILKILIAIVVVIVVNALTSLVPIRIDLTSEKRYSLTENTKQILSGLEDTLRVQVLMSDNAPQPFNKIQSELNDLLYEFKLNSSCRLEYEFVDPFFGKNKKQAQQAYEYFVSTGLQPVTDVETMSNGTRKEVFLFPCAYISWGGRTLAVNFYKPVSGKSKEANIHYATQNLEYELINAVKRLTTFECPTVGFLSSHGTLDNNELSSIKHSLAEYYRIRSVKIDSVECLDSISTLVIAKPEQAFTESEKYVIDQFAMNGGNILWLLETMNVSMDSLKNTSSTIAFARDLNLSDQLFKYGVRINNNLVLDNQCNTIMVNVAPAGMQPKFNPAPWYYSPLVTPNMQHPITKNLNLIQTEFISQIDTVGNSASVKKTILLQSSSYAKVLNVPVPISFSILEQRPDERFFDRYKEILGVLLEGEFESLYKNRKLPMKTNRAFVEMGRRAKMLVVADGDLIRNEIRVRGLDTIPMQLGVNKYTKQTFGNTDFIVNAINYMNDDSDLLNLRSRELTIRLLNKPRVQSERTMWQIVNVVAPISLIILIGICTNFIRKRRYK